MSPYNNPSKKIDNDDKQVESCDGSEKDEKADSNQGSFADTTSQPGSPTSMQSRPNSTSFASGRGFSRCNQSNSLHSASRMQQTQFSMQQGITSEQRRKSSLQTPHIAFMQRRTRTKPRETGSRDILPSNAVVTEPDDDLSRMKPFIRGPEPHFLLMQRYTKRQIKTTRGYRLSQKTAQPEVIIQNSN